MVKAQVMEKLQSLIFEVSEYIPNGKYLEIMDEVLKVHNYIEELKEPESISESESETGSETESDYWLVTVPGFNVEANELVNECYKNDYITDDLILRLKEWYSPEYIAYKLNSFFNDNQCFYCPVYDKLVFDEFNTNFVQYDYLVFMNEQDESELEDHISKWVFERFHNVLEQNGEEY
jgi:hypothetical protein